MDLLDVKEWFMIADEDLEATSDISRRDWSLVASIRPHQIFFP